ncbi:hypothetical protein PF003_g10620 [Phytophthora fragariae]|nr:hypothetical protein PF003_g10620 [Phytophthora fragariae]
MVSTCSISSKDAMGSKWGQMLEVLLTTTSFEHVKSW